MVPINKISPRMPTENDFRPIIVSSLVCKFMEGLVMNRLKKVKLNYKQYGFRQGRGIEECKC
jgi:hypothetical protein